MACAAAEKIRNNNLAEVGVNVAISFFAGIFLPGAISGIGTLKAAGIFFGTNIAGLGITWTVLYGQRAYMRNNDDFADNPVYHNLNNEVDKNKFFQVIDDPSDPNDVASLALFQKAVKEGKLLTHNLRINQMLDNFSRMSTDQLKNNADYIKFTKDVSSGVYGNGLKSSMANIFGRVKPNSSSVAKGMKFSAENFKISLKQMAKAGGTGALFFLPVIGNYFSEKTRQAFAEEAVKDMTNGTNVVAQLPLGI